MRNLIIIACVLLFISPIDLNPFPDFVPVIGWIDEILYGAVGLAALTGGNQRKRR